MTTRAQGAVATVIKMPWFSLLHPEEALEEKHLDQGSALSTNYPDNMTQRSRSIGSAIANFFDRS